MRKVKTLIYGLSGWVMLLSMAISCQKDILIHDNLDEDDPDEIGYAIDTDTTTELEERASSFKIIQAITKDSLPILNASGKRQKYAKRQVVFTTQKTRSYLKGYGFKAQDDSMSHEYQFILFTCLYLYMYCIYISNFLLNDYLSSSYELRVHALY